MGATALPVLALLLPGCVKAPTASGPLPQRGYLWQREWSPAVTDAVREAERRTNGVVILGAELKWEAAGPKIIRPKIDWARLAGEEMRIALALRVAPYAGTFAADDAHGRAVVAQAKELVEQARMEGVSVNELQLDFDATERTLEGYRLWVQAVRRAIAPVPLVITTLPSWLDQRAFARLVGDADGFVLQVHSVPNLRKGGEAAIFDPERARRWVKQAAKLHRAFSVALPTYRCAAAYDSSGHLLGVALDGVQPSWPRDARILEVKSEPSVLAALVREWTAARPVGLEEIIWYRLPVEKEERNWRWPTLAAVMDGRAPAATWTARASGENPLDFALQNRGEADDGFTGSVELRWHGARVLSSEALPGWELTVESERAVFRIAPGQRLRLPPGEARAMGWLRYDQVAKVDLTVAPDAEAPPAGRAH